MRRIMQTVALALGFLIIAGQPPCPTMARTNAPPSQRPVIARSSGLWIGGPQGDLVRSGADTLCLLGDDGDDRGDFQLPGSLAPSWDDWYGVDLSAWLLDPLHWHIDTYQAADLDPLTVPNHAWWCGEPLPSCGPGDPDGGYGNNYEERLDWWGEVPDPAQPAQVQLAAVLNYDNEPGYDYLHLQYEDVAGLHTLQIWNGQQDGVVVAAAHGFDIVDYVPHPDTGEPSIHLRFRFESDGGWSDEDCSWPTQGGAQIDLIQVFFDQGEGAIQIGPTEDCEDHDGNGQYEDDAVWRPQPHQGVGDFAHVWPLLDDLDPCYQNNTPQVAFIDDGIVVPGTGGSHCLNWCYGPGGYTVNVEGGLLGPGHSLANEIWSPVLAWPDPAGGYDGAFLEFTVYRHLDLFSCDHMFYVWHVRSTDAGEPGWTEWRDRDIIYYYGGPDYYRQREDLSDLLLPERKQVQIALGVHQLSWMPCWDYTDPTPAPYFDNVRVCTYRLDGPAITALAIDLAQDSFPAGGQLDCANPCANSVRFDVARNIMPANGNQPGDSIACSVVSLRAGTELAQNPELVYFLRPNPLFDACRTSGLPNRGTVPGDSTYTPFGDVVPHRFHFDLPDTGFFFPGDVIHYYIRATETGLGTTILPGDTSGFSLFPGDAGYEMLQYHGPFVVRALPGIRDLESCAQPAVLWWNDFAGGGLEAEWMHALHGAGLAEGVDFDVYETNGPSSGVGNGLGGRATASQLLGYDVLLYSSGDLDRFTITDVDYNNDPGDDIGVLDTWLRAGGKGAFLTGNGLVRDLDSTSGATLAFLDTWIQAELLYYNNAYVFGRYNLTAQAFPVTGNPVFTNATRWGTDLFCNPVVRSMDVVNALGTPGRIAEFLSTDCEPGAYPHAAAIQTVNATYEANVIYLPYDLGFVVDDQACGGPALPGLYSTRALILRDVLEAFGQATSPPVVAVPAAGSFVVRGGIPNPFNPRTQIDYEMPRAGRLSLVIYDLKGQRVRVLRGDVVPAGPGFVIWDGTDEGGRAVASGAYFCRTQALGQEDVQKLLLVR
jgi:hypothetical protein